VSTTWMQTASGGKATPSRLDPGQVRVEDIAHSLGNLCRWTGHCRYFFSVAQHCVLVSEALTERENRPDLALHGLIHDASESFTNDINSPLKCAPEMLGYRYVERRAEDAILSALGMDPLQPEDQAVIKRVDLRMMATEAKTFGLMSPLHPDWTFDEPPYDDHAIPWFWYPYEARQKWIERYRLLTVGQ